MTTSAARRASTLAVAAIIGVFTPTMVLVLASVIVVVALIAMLYSMQSKSGDAELAWFVFAAFGGFGLAGAWIGVLIRTIMHWKVI